MRVLFSLYISCITEENYWAEYLIGLFQSAKDAEVEKKRLMGKGSLFSKPNCKARICEIELIGELTVIEQVYRFYGQNLDSSCEGDIVESACYTDKSEAIEALIKAKKHTPRQQWNLETHKVRKCNS